MGKVGRTYRVQTTTHYTVASSGMRLDFNQESGLDIIAARTS